MRPPPRNPRVTKEQLSRAVAGRLARRASIKACLQVFEAMREAVVAFLARGLHVELRGWGTWEVRPREARPGWDFRRRKTVPIPAQVVPVINFAPDFLRYEQKGIRPAAAERKKTGPVPPPPKPPKPSKALPRNKKPEPPPPPKPIFNDTGMGYSKLAGWK